MPQEQLHSILKLLADAPLPEGCKQRKITFAGGEPMLSKTIIEDLQFAHSLGFVTSLVTNGSLLTPEPIKEMEGKMLNWITFSIDGVDHDTNQRIGRASRGRTQTADDYLAKIYAAKAAGIRVKINTVVNRINLNNDFTDFIIKACPLRWKLLQVSRVEEENGSCFDRWGISTREFESFVQRHRDSIGPDVTVVPETQSDIRGSYAMISPDGRFFDTANASYNYSRPILEVGVETAFSNINFCMDRFTARDGDYDFDSGANREGGSQ